MEINILLLLLVIHYIIFFFNKTKSDILCCGILAWSGRTPRGFNRDKFNILGLFNNSRGGDSCGVATDGEIYYGTLLNKNYDDFIINKGYIQPTKIPAVIGHTRKASVGVVNQENAHPFGFGDHEEGYAFIGCHNGTLSNHAELAKEYGVETTVYNDKNVYERTKVDSEVLLEILYSTGKTEVLEKYIGGAALVFQKTNEPNVIYAFHGASKKEVGDKSETLYEERPLYYYQESKESVYISSLKEALQFIGGVEDETIFEFKHNLLYRIENGNVSKALTYRIDRREAGQKKGYSVGFHNGGTANSGTTNNRSSFHHNKKDKKKERSKSRRLKKIENVNNIYDETVISDDFKSSIYYNRLRYWRNGHLITGIYTFITGFGFYKIGEENAEANQTLYQLIGEHFSLKDGVFIDSRILDNMLEEDDTLFIPFDFGNYKEPPVFYMYEGIMLETAQDYVVLNSPLAKKFSFEDLSMMSKYPICKMSKTRFADDRQGILSNGKSYTCNIMPLQSNSCYNIENGNLISIDRYEEEVVKEAEICCSLDFQADKTPPVIQLPMNFNTAEKSPNAALHINKDLASSLNDKPVIEFLDEDPPIEEMMSEEEDLAELTSIINTHFVPIYEQIQVCNENLRDHKSKTIQEMIEVQKECLISIDYIVESKEK